MVSHVTSGNPLKPCRHTGTRVEVGDHRVILGSQDFDVNAFNLDGLVTLSGCLPYPFGNWCDYPVLNLAVPEYGPVPKNWGIMLQTVVIPQITADDRLAAFCNTGHGRTGLFAASLIALMEDADTVPDPIAAARERYCPYAVETIDQGRAVFALRAAGLPLQYERSLLPNYRQPA